jgi:glycosyltransferase involved in cell wall biosynthesis
VLFFSHGVSLKQWQDSGLYDREVEYYRRLRQHLDAVVFVTYDTRQNGGDGLRRQLDIEVLHNRWGLNYRLFGLLAPLLWRRRIARCAVLKTNQLTGAWTGVIAKWCTRKPLIVRCGYIPTVGMRMTGESKLRQALWRVLERISVGSADLVFAATEADRAYLVDSYGVPEQRTAIIPTPIDMERFRPPAVLRKEEGLLSYVGRLSSEKDVGLLLDAVRQVPSCRLQIAGTGPLESELRRRAADMPVTFLGVVPNDALPEVLSRSEIFVLPSRYEGSPKALLEAMACGLAVIGRDVPGTRTVIQHGRNGILFAGGAGELSRSIATLLADADLRARLGAEARRYVVSRYAMDAVAAKEAEQIGALLDGRTTSVSTSAVSR